MREIVLDTETTGFEPTEGDRIVEIGAVELFNHLPTGKTYHQYINPMRACPPPPSRFTASVMNSCENTRFSKT